MCRQCQQLKNVFWSPLFGRKIRLSYKRVHTFHFLGFMFGLVTALSANLPMIGLINGFKPKIVCLLSLQKTSRPTSPVLQRKALEKPAIFCTCLSSRRLAQPANLTAIGSDSFPRHLFIPKYSKFEFQTISWSQWSVEENLEREKKLDEKPKSK